MANGFAKPVMMQVATPGEALHNPDMLLVRYNGHPGEDVSDMQLEDLGADTQWYGRRKVRDGGPVQFGPGYPVRVRKGRWCAIPNCKENLEILERMKKHVWSTQERTPDGPVSRKIDHPPLYELVTEEVTQVSPEMLLAAFSKLSAADKAALLGGLTSPESAPAPEGSEAIPAPEPEQAETPAPRRGRG